MRTRCSENHYPRRNQAQPDLRPNKHLLHLYPFSDQTVVLTMLVPGGGCVAKSEICFRISKGRATAALELNCLFVLPILRGRKRFTPLGRSKD